MSGSEEAKLPEECWLASLDWLCIENASKVICEMLHGGVAQRWVGVGGFCDNGLKVLLVTGVTRECYFDGRLRCEREAGDSAPPFATSAGRQCTAEELTDYKAKPVNVSASIYRCAGELLGGHVRERAHEQAGLGGGGGLGTGSEESRDAEVDDFGLRFVCAADYEDI